MKKQISIIASTVLALGVALGLAAVSASAQAVEVQAKIPFGFVVLEKTLPAGEYTMTSGPHELKITDTNRRLVATLLANEVVGRSAAGTGKVIFHCYNDRCFLSELQSPTLDKGRQLLMSRAEAALAKEQPPKYFAVMGEAPSK